MLFRQIYDEKLSQYAYLIGCQQTGEALVIDPERDVERYIDIAKREGLRIAAVTETHIHADFLSGTRELAERIGAKVYLSAEGGEEWSYRWIDPTKGGSRCAHELLRDGHTFTVGKIELRAVHCPGHTPEHISFMVTDRGGGASEPMGMISGDFVFVGAVGRPDLLESAAGVAGAMEPSARRLYGSLQEFRRLPEYLQVWPGHGAGSACGKSLGAVPESTVGYELRFNASIRAAVAEDEFVRHILEGQPEPPLYFARMKRLNRDGPPILGGLPEPRAIDAKELAALAGTQDVAVVDTRTRPEFLRAHLPGSYFIPLIRSFPTTAGSFLDPEQAIFLIVAEERLREAVVDLIRIGYDRIEGWATPDTLAAALTAAGGGAATEAIDFSETRRRLEQGKPLVLDVRKATEFEEGHVPNAINISHTRLASRLDELPKDRRILVHCRSGERAAASTALLQRFGFDAVLVNDGFPAWGKAGGKVITAGAGVS